MAEMPFSAAVKPAPKAYDPYRRDAHHDETLRAVLKRVGDAKSPKVVVFDLDSTLFDNRPRQTQILREFGIMHDVPELYQAMDAHIVDWDLKKPILATGIDQERADDLFPKVRAFWKARFFTSPYCLYDVALPGAPRYVSALHASDAIIVYLTGRHEEMRQGTHQSLVRFGFPEPGTKNVQLLMKPSLAIDDTPFKAEAHMFVKTLGTVLAAFDNEPAHARDLRLAFPEATVVWVDSDHSHGEVVPDLTMPRVFGFVSELL